MLDELKANNRAWAESLLRADAGFFQQLERGQAPKYLWLGCSDSRVPANEVVGLGPGEIFVHRNIANRAPANDTNWRSVLQYAVAVLKVEHIIVTGHYGCGGVRAAVEGGTDGPIAEWLAPVRGLADEHRQELDSIDGAHARVARLCELNVMRQVRDVAADPFVQAAWAGHQPLCVHGWIYNLGDGLVRDLTVTVCGPNAAS